MSLPVYLPDARQDLRDIKAYISRENRKAARKVADAIKMRCELIALVPGIGRTREELGPGLCSLPSGSYLIVYRICLGAPVEIVRIVHGHRDLNALFKP